MKQAFVPGMQFVGTILPCYHHTHLPSCYPDCCPCCHVSFVFSGLNCPRWNVIFCFSNLRFCNSVICSAFYLFSFQSGHSCFTMLLVLSWWQSIVVLKNRFSEFVVQLPSKSVSRCSECPHWKGRWKACVIFSSWLHLSDLSPWAQILLYVFGSLFCWPICTVHLIKTTVSWQTFTV